jgi:hypothetical protein
MDVSARGDEKARGDEGQGPPGRGRQGRGSPSGARACTRAPTFRTARRPGSIVRLRRPPTGGRHVTSRRSVDGHASCHRRRPPLPARTRVSHRLPYERKYPLVSPQTGTVSGRPSKSGPHAPHVLMAEVERLDGMCTRRRLVSSTDSLISGVRCSARSVRSARGPSNTVMRSRLPRTGMPRRFPGGPHSARGTDRPRSRPLEFADRNAFRRLARGLGAAAGWTGRVRGTGGG